MVVMMGMLRPTRMKMRIVYIIIKIVMYPDQPASHSWKMTCCGGPTLFPFQLRALTPGHAETVEDRLRIFLVQKRVRCAATGYESAC